MKSHSLSSLNWRRALRICIGLVLVGLVLAAPLASAEAQVPELLQSDRTVVDIPKGSATIGMAPEALNWNALNWNTPFWGTTPKADAVR